MLFAIVFLKIHGSQPHRFFYTARHMIHASSLELSPNADSFATGLTAAAFFPLGIMSPYFFPFINIDIFSSVDVGALQIEIGVLYLEKTTERKIMDVVPKSQPTVDEAQWEEKVKAYHLPRAEINKVSSRGRWIDNSAFFSVQVVMEYLVKEGFKDAVGAFQEESGIDPGINMSMLDDQIRIRDAVEAGKVVRQTCVESCISHLR